MTRLRFLRLGFGVAISALLLGLVIRAAGGGALLSTLRAVDPFWVALGTCALLAAYAARIARWHAMLRLTNPRLTLRGCAGPFLISVAANNTLPFRAGDALRCFAFQNTLGVHNGIVFASLLVERLFDLLILIALLALALVAFSVNIPGLAGTGPLLLAASALLFFAVLVRPRAFAPALNRMIAPVARVSPRLHQAAARILAQVIATFAHLSTGRHFPRIALWSLSVWVLEGVAFLCAALAVPGLGNAVAALLALPTATLATLIPGTPGHIGTFDYFAAGAMTTLGIDAASAGAFAILIHLIIVIPPTLLGGLAAIRWPQMRTPKLEYTIGEGV